MRKQLVPSIIIVSFLILATIALVLYAKGYRFGLQSGIPEIAGTGLLVVKSQPDGAQVFLNGHLTTATNNTLNLSPQEYNVKIVKDGYFPWEKKIKIQKEIVSTANALLFPLAPKLESITDTGVNTAVIDPSQTQIAFTVNTQASRKNGIYILDMTSRPILTLQSASTQIADDTIDIFSQSALSWSPDGRQLLATVSGELGTSTTYLLEARGLNENPKDISETLPSFEAAFDKQRQDKEKARIDSLKPVLKNLIAENFKILSWSLDETKILHTASVSASLPLIITPPLIGANSSPQEREIQKDLLYAYDIKEDKNFKIDVGTKSLTWFPDSRHLMFVQDGKISIVEYDGTNKTTVYAGPFVDEYVFPWPDGSKIVIVTNLGNSTIPPNLYTIGLK